MTLVASSCPAADESQMHQWRPMREDRRAHNDLKAEQQSLYGVQMLRPQGGVGRRCEVVVNVAENGRTRLDHERVAIGRDPIRSHICVRVGRDSRDTRLQKVYTISRRGIRMEYIAMLLDILCAALACH